jgi:chromosome segregation ATPase
MGKNWHKKFQELDGTRAREAAEALRDRLEELKIRLANAQAEKEALEALVPEAEAAFEESLLGDEEAQAQAKSELVNLWEKIDAASKKIEVIEATLKRERKSPELGRLAGELWDVSEGFRAALIEIFPDALRELTRAQQSYLKAVARIGELGVTISRLERMMNAAASPFMAEGKYQSATPLPAIFMTPEEILAAYDPNRTLAPPGVNPEALRQANPDADTALAVLADEGE